MGADQVLTLRVVTADGQFLTASPSENSDLFWAIRGGGGSTFGVVTSMVVKAYPDTRTSVATFDWGVKESNITKDTYWKGVSSYFSYFENFTNQGLFSEYSLYARDKFPNDGPPDGQPRISISPFLGIGWSVDQLKGALKPWLDELAGIGIEVKATWSQFPSYYPAYFSQIQHTDTNIMPYNLAYGSRLFPRENFDRLKKLNATVAAYRALSEGDHMFNAFMVSPTLEKGAPVAPGNAVLPAWRNSLSHTIVFVQWPENATMSEQLEVRKQFTHNWMQTIRDITPGSGSYMSESDRMEPEWQKAFFGENYPRLLEIKKKYDPKDVFYAVTAVGSENWAVKSVDGLTTENGRLCHI